MTAPPSIEALLDALADRLAVRIVAGMRSSEATELREGPLVDQSTLAKHLGCNVRTVYAMRQQGLPVVWVGDSPRFRLPVVMTWLEARGGPR